MNQTIEEQRHQAAEQYAGSFEGPYRKDAYYAHLHGQEEEYHRTKWVKVEDSRPEGLGVCLFRPDGERWPSIVSKSDLRKGWTDFPGSTWAEIPL